MGIAFQYKTTRNIIYSLQNDFKDFSWYGLDYVLIQLVSAARVFENQLFMGEDYSLRYTFFVCIYYI